MHADSAKLAQEAAFAPNVVEGTFEFQGEMYNFKATPKQETKMSNQHRDKDQQNYLIDQAEAIRSEIEVSVLSPSGTDTPPCAEAWTTAKLIAELLCRIEALEAAAKPNHPAEPDGSLVERVEDAIYSGTGGGIREEARAAIREVADWFEEQGGPIALGWAMRLEEEAKR